MEISCLVGVCSALAQTAGEAAEAAAPAASAASDAGAAAGTIGDVLKAVGVLCVIAAQLRAGRIVRRYQKDLVGLMGAASKSVFGAFEDVRWDAATLLAGLESRRRAVLAVLTGVVTVYSLAAALVLIGFAESRHSAALTWLSVGVSFLMFASFSAPVVLLGVSASNFNRLFWSWFAPATFTAVAMQAMVANVAPEERLDHVTRALLIVLAVSVAAVALRHGLPLRHRLALVAWRARRPVLSVVILVLAALVAIVAFAGLAAEEVFLHVFVGCIVGALAIGLCYFTLVDRIRRIVAPLLAAGYFAAIGAALMLFELLNERVDALGELAGGAAAIALIAGALGAGWLARQFVLSWIGLAYQQKVFSDAQFQVFCWMLSVSGAVVSVNTLASDTRKLLDPVNLLLLGATLLALVVYWAVTRFGLRPLASNKRLLVLRVFSRERRSERLLDELEYRWRFIGPIVLIGGADVAERTIDPDKAANYLRGRMKHVFVPNVHELNKRVVAMDEAPDPDGRYRVNEFLCFDDLWKEAVRRLLDASDAVVVDLSEFSAERRGTAYELGLLREFDALPRTVFLVSGRTDLAAARAALGLGADAALPVAVIQVESAPDGKQLVEALVQRIPVAGPDPAAARVSEVAAATAG